MRSSTIKELTTTHACIYGLTHKHCDEESTDNFNRKCKITIQSKVNKTVPYDMHINWFIIAKLYCSVLPYCTILVRHTIRAFQNNMFIIFHFTCALLSVQNYKIHIPKRICRSDSRKWLRPFDHLVRRIWWSGTSTNCL